MLRVAVSLIGILLVHFAGFTEAQATGVLPIEQFTRHDEFGGIKLSPDGNYAAYMTGDTGRTIIVFLSLKDRKRTGGIRIRNNFIIYDFDWVSDTRIVYRVAERVPGLNNPILTGEMLAVDFDGQREEFIFGFRAAERQINTIIKVREASRSIPEVITPVLADGKTILIKEDPWNLGKDAKPHVSRLNVFTGVKTTLDRVPLFNARVLADRNDQVRFAIGLNDNSQPAVAWKPDGKGKWVEFVLPEFDSESLTLRFISEDNQWMFFTGARLTEPVRSLYKVNLTTKEIVKVYGSDSADVAGIVSDLADQKVIGVWSDLGKPEVHWLDETDKAARIYKALHRGFPGQTIRIVSATRDGQLAVVLVSSDVNPGEYYLFDTHAMKADFLQAARRGVDRQAMRPKEVFNLKSRDGLELTGYLTKPAGNPPYPLVVLPHGGPHGVRDVWTYEWDVQLLANRGYAVLQVNFRGSGGFGKQFESLGYRQWGATMQDDVTDATRWAIDQKLTTADRICIFGASYGGYAALQGAVREPDLYHCAIGYAGVYDLELMYSSADIPLAKSGKAYLEKVLGSDRDELRSRSPAYNADKIKVPVLLIHGKEDWRADFDQAKRMKAALEKNNKQLEWMALSREGHGIFSEETRREVYERVLKFLDTHLMQTQQSTAAR